MTYRFAVIALTNCATLFSAKLGTEKIYKILVMLDFIVYFCRKYVTTWNCPIPPEAIRNIHAMYLLDPILPSLRLVETVSSTKKKTINDCNK